MLFFLEKRSVPLQISSYLFRALCFSFVGIAFIHAVLALDALVIFASFYDCDLKLSGQIKAPDQVCNIKLFNLLFYIRYSYNAYLHNRHNHQTFHSSNKPQNPVAILKKVNIEINNIESLTPSFYLFDCSNHTSGQD